MISCIYKISNLINNKFYIGSAVNFSKRKALHLHTLRNNKHPNKHLQFSFNKHGESNFEFSVIEICSKDVLIQREQFYIDNLSPNFNMCKIAGSSLGRKPTTETINKMRIAHSKRDCKQTEESKRKLSFAHVGKIIDSETREKISLTLSIPIIQIDKQGKIIKEFKSTKDAFEKTKIYNITSVLKNKRKFAGNFEWKYKNLELC